MDPDDDVCVCFHVPLRKIRAYLARENPPVPSLISDCLGAGTGCGWCVPFLKHLHRCHVEGREPDLAISPERYARERLRYHALGVRDEQAISDAAGSARPGAIPPGPPMKDCS